MYDVYLFFDNQFRGLSDSIHNLDYDTESGLVTETTVKVIR